MDVKAISEITFVIVELIIDNIPLKTIQRLSIEVPNGGWTPEGSYERHYAMQDSDEWIEAKEEIELSASNFGAAAGLHRFKTIEVLEQELWYGIKAPIPEANRILMKRGLELEKLLRQYLIINYNLPIRQIGLIRPLWDRRLGASLDGIYTDSQTGELVVVEFKTRKKMPWVIRQYMNKLRNGWVPPPYYHDHIFPQDYCQIIGQMTIINALRCLYVVYCEATQELFMCMVERDRDYWSSFLYPAIDKFMKRKPK